MATQTIAQKVQPFLFVPSKKSNKQEVLATEALVADPNLRIGAIDTRLMDKTAFLPVETGPEELRKLKRNLENTRDSNLKVLGEQRFRLSRHERHIKMVRAGYPNQLDLSFLASTKNFPISGIFSLGRTQAWPAFGVVNVQNEAKTFQIEARATSSPYGTDTYQTHLPKPMGIQYSATINTLIKLSKKSDYSGVFLSAKVGGIMPDTTRDKIMEALEKKIFDQVYIIFEVFDWELNVVKPVPQDDPIVIGWCNDTEQAFVIDIYNPTGLEQYVADQFGFTTTLPEDL